MKNRRFKRNKDMNSWLMYRLLYWNRVVGALFFFYFIIFFFSVSDFQLLICLSLEIALYRGYISQILWQLSFITQCYRIGKHWHFIANTTKLVSLRCLFQKYSVRVNNYVTRSLKVWRLTKCQMLQSMNWRPYNMIKLRFLHCVIKQLYWMYVSTLGTFVSVYSCE